MPTDVICRLASQVEHGREYSTVLLIPDPLIMCLSFSPPFSPVSIPLPALQSFLNKPISPPSYRCRSVMSLFAGADFDFSVPGSMKLHNLISKLKKWIKILEAKTKQLPKFFLIEEKCRFLSNFSAQTAEVEIPGEFLMPKPTHYYIKIAR